MADVITLFAAASSNGTSASHDLGDVKDEMTAEVVTTGSPTFSVQLQGSLDGTNWYSLGAAATATGSYSVNGTLARWVRATLASLSGGTLTLELGFGAGL